MRIKKPLVVGVSILATASIFLAGCDIDDLNFDLSSGQTEVIDEEAFGYTPSENIYEAIGQITVADDVVDGTYDRDLYPHWEKASAEFGFADPTYYNCNTRTVVMYEDGINVDLDPADCRLMLDETSGWQDEYGYIDPKGDGEMNPYLFVTNSSEMDMEHIVALGDAHRSGGYAWDEDKRTSLANDRLNLVPSDPSANRSKGDQDVADYLPPGKFRCEYLDRYIQVKVKYDLTARQDAVDRMYEEADRCGWTS